MLRHRFVTTCWAASIACLIGVLTPAITHAANQGPAGINLGATSFMDGFGRPVEGWTYQTYLQYSMGRAINDANGNAIPVFRDPKVDVWGWLNQISYWMPDTFFGDTVRPAINLIVPVVAFNTSFGQPGPALTDNGIGFADVTLGPMFQFKPIMSAEGRPLFSHRFEFDFLLPFGAYDHSKNINQSANYISFNPNWAATVVPLPGFEISVRLHWLYNMLNQRPVNPPMGVMVDTAQAGQTVWANFATSYEIVHGLHVGANGYYLKQLTADTYHLVDGSTTNGVAVGEGKQQVLAIGPGVLWDITEKDKLWANVYFQAAVQERIKSTAFNLRYLHSF